MSQPFTLLILFLSAICWSESDRALSPQGIQRLKENLAVLETNISDTKKNVQTSQANVSTIDKDLKELDVLQKQYVELRKKHLDYKSGIDKEWKKNEASLKELAKFETASRTPNSTLKLNPGDLDRAMKEKQERESWKESAAQKLMRADGLLKGVDESVSGIQARRASLNRQKSHWQGRLGDHQKLLRVLEKKKSETEIRLGKIEKGRPAGQPSSSKNH